ncbi:MAG: ABC transporter ATP-binding protein [Puniceicoccaceae bacterium]|nr:MAG: ABC transporter ATP-binding protein [Puniceicoccaceae bacterium]
MKEYLVETETLTKSYPGETPKAPEMVVFENVNFRIKEGEFITCIGHSGCGKSTILNILAGLQRPSSGYSFLKGKEISAPGLDRAVVFQGHSLLPWLTAYENVAFAVKSRWADWSKAQVREHSMEYLNMVGLGGAADRKPHQLSGGMKQRVGIARAFAMKSRLLLMDEPFGALDALTRGSIQEELVKICASTGQTVFMITHDVDEAILLSDRIFLMTNGPRANIAECVIVDIPKPRDRGQIIHEAGYYTIRNHLVDFLVSRSRELSGATREVAAHEIRTETGALIYPPDVNPLETATAETVEA